MNFDHINKMSDYFRNQLFPNLSNKMQVIDFGNYLSKMADVPSFHWMKSELKVLPVNYLVDPVAFTKKYAKKCVAFTGTTGPQEGAFNFIYQMSSTMHVLARLFHWVEREEVRAYLMLTVTYRDLEEFVKFFDDNKSLRLTGNTEERELGFKAIPSNSQGDELRKLMQGFKSPPKELEDQNEMEDSP